MVAYPAMTRFAVMLGLLTAPVSWCAGESPASSRTVVVATSAAPAGDVLPLTVPDAGPVPFVVRPGTSAALPDRPSEAAPIIPVFDEYPDTGVLEEEFEEPAFIEDLAASDLEPSSGPASGTVSSPPTASPSPALVSPSTPVAEGARSSRSSSGPLVLPPGFAPVRGLHLTSWVAGSRKARGRFLDRLRGTVINAVIIPIKETDGKVYLPGVAAAEAAGTTRIAIPKPKELLADLEERGIRAVARQVVFEDDNLPRKRPELGVQDEDGGLWKNRKGLTWADPYNQEVWEYNLAIAQHALRLGFDEVQFDYIRFPSDGDTRRCRYSNVHHSSRTTVQALDGFLRAARERLKPLGGDISVAVFGLTTTSSGDMGIGQNIRSMESEVDALSPMMYPSHYAKGEYGIPDPNREPYEVIRLGLRDAKRRLRKDAFKLRPYLQDFTLGYRYKTEHVRAQIRAAREQGIDSWIFWNPGNRYHWDAFRDAPPESTVVAPSSP